MPEVDEVEHLRKRTEENNDAIKNLIALTATLTDNYEKLVIQQRETDKAITELSTAIQAHMKAEDEHEKTLRHIDNAVQEIRRELPKLMLQMHKESEQQLNPVYERIRENERSLADFKTHAEREHNDIEEKVKTDLRREAKNHIIVLWAVFVFISSIVGYLITDLKDNVEVNSEHRIMSHGNNHMRETP